MKAISAFLALPVLLNLLTAAPQQIAAQRDVARYSRLGELRVEADESVGNAPRLVISEALSGRSIFSKALGDPILPEMVSRPILRFTVNEGPRPQSPLILAVAMSPGGSDCGYEGIVVGESKGRLAVLTPKPVGTYAEGGMYLGDLGNSRGFGLAVWNFIWAEDESHVDKHRYEVSLYRYDAVQSRFKLIDRVVSKQKYDLPAEALAELGLHYENVFRRFPEFSC
jgi:hypothetical protein